MNRPQWFVSGIGLFLLSMFMFMFAITSFCGYQSSDGALIACTIQKYAYAIPALVSFFLAHIFTINGFLEPKVKNKK